MKLASYNLQCMHIIFYNDFDNFVPFDRNSNCEDKVQENDIQNMVWEHRDLFSSTNN